eukprot:597559-Amphidinium_carterae.2
MINKGAGECIRRTSQGSSLSYWSWLMPLSEAVALMYRHTCGTSNPSRPPFIHLCQIIWMPAVVTGRTKFLDWGLQLSPDMIRKPSWNISPKCTKASTFRGAKHLAPHYTFREGKHHDFQRVVENTMLCKLGEQSNVCLGIVRCPTVAEFSLEEVAAIRPTT